MTPLADAMRLVDRHHLQIERVQQLPDGGVEALGRGIQQLELPRPEPRRPPRALGGIQRGIEESRTDPELAHGIDLILHERDQRRYHQGHSALEPRRDLVRHRLSGAGGHHGETVAAGHHGVDDFRLPGTERGIAEHLLQHLERRTRRVRNSGLPRACRGLAQQRQGLRREQERRLAIALPQPVERRFNCSRGKLDERARLREHVVHGVECPLHQGADRARTGDASATPFSGSIG